MQVPLEITYNHVSRSDWIDDYIKSRVDKLEHLSDNIVACRVVIEQTQSPHRTGNPYRAHVEVSLPAKRELVADKTETVTDPQVQLRPIIRHAFEAMEKQLKKQNGKRGGRKVKHYEGGDELTPSVATVVRMFEEEGYGFLKNLSGEEIYFHRNSVLHDDFDRLTVGSQVRFEPEEGEKGPQASTVQIIDKPGVAGSQDVENDVEQPAGWERRH
ncbi:cold shock domain-containing protein [Halomonas sp. McH1-25]|uniref:HPF/RaiA family ribosome-associated protein n=1 Tax=unclassified Halomonas TaxID=2609666 RepID=UPI001EF57115|nr:MULTISPECIES: HPF/RaiA family ribosome-associated protein [unclassified Halomonas]MCG7598802.1 cold shock domain-containing protein [Halomonas sp. McH1-25]MCP1340765.1 cold shock domain-containing protein [Halomonas sp. FL8]MCP1359536.1 cold shock domain-containing protein [Halomonas sp. BBD45]MCP1364351.1 cold shock domain-containing protein [Halomonas sp. BBD48]